MGTTDRMRRDISSALAVESGASRSGPQRIDVTVHCEDPLTRAGIASHLRTEPLIALRDTSAQSSGGVAIVLADRLDDFTAARLRRLAQTQQVVFVVGQLPERELLRALDLRVTAIVLRHQATPERLVNAVRSAVRGDRDLPGDLVGQLVDVVHRLLVQADGHVAPTASHGPTDRELDVLRLLAEGWETRVIATRLAYSERTVKNVLQGFTARFQLRNRAHAVAFAFREGYL
ncbi:response regulator transcription factor [Cryptosporangium japonicum]|uniref:Response regulator transcription factor n=1 Tax=Cryptosporangium japonicum TaxID=80872 RepID=A0ABP3DE32_9ACTN